MRQRAVQDAANACLITDASHPEHPIIDANPGFITLTGRSREAVLGRNGRFLQGLGTDPVAINALRQTIAMAQPQPVTVLKYRADGTPFWNEGTVFPRPAGGIHAACNREGGEPPDRDAT